MDIIKINYQAISKLITSYVPAIRFIDEDNGQLTDYEQPPVMFPCVLIDTGQVFYDNTEDLLKTAKCQVKVTVGFELLTPTDSLTPDPYVFDRSETIEAVKNTIQGFEPEHSSGFIIESNTRLKRPGYVIRELTYNISYFGRSV